MPMMQVTNVFVLGLGVLLLFEYWKLVLQVRGGILILITPSLSFIIQPINMFSYDTGLFSN